MASRIGHDSFEFLSAEKINSHGECCGSTPHMDYENPTPRMDYQSHPQTQCMEALMAVTEWTKDCLQQRILCSVWRKRFYFDWDICDLQMHTQHNYQLH
jgi:hypothetical protein